MRRNSWKMGRQWNVLHRLITTSVTEEEERTYICYNTNSAYTSLMAVYNIHRYFGFSFLVLVGPIFNIVKQLFVIWENHQPFWMKSENNPCYTLKQRWVEVTIFYICSYLFCQKQDALWRLFIFDLHYSTWFSAYWNLLYLNILRCSVEWILG